MVARELGFVPDAALDLALRRRQAQLDHRERRECVGAAAVGPGRWLGHSRYPPSPSPPPAATHSHPLRNLRLGLPCRDFSYKCVMWVVTYLVFAWGQGVRDTRHLAEHSALLSVSLDDADETKIRAVLDQGQPPQGCIWSHERGL
jgi:hypothetical protein